MTNPMIDRPVFIVGMPRSGSTAFHEVLARQPEFATTTHVSRKFPVCLPLLRLIAPFYRVHRPGEAGTMWDRFVGAESDVLTAADVTPAARKFYTTAVTNVVRLYGRPRFLSKCPRNGLRMAFLHALFPDARFIHLIRDGRAVCQSVMERRRRAGDVQAWWDVKPAGWRQWASLEPVVACAHQWDEVVRAVAETGAALPSEQYLEVRYEDFTADPVGCMRGVAGFCGVVWSDAAIAEATREISSRNDKWAKVFSADEVARMMAVMGPTMARFGYA
jgi:hypothetical protein